MEKEKAGERAYKMLRPSRHVWGYLREFTLSFCIVLLYPAGHTDGYQILVFFIQKSVSFPFQTTESTP